MIRRVYMLPADMHARVRAFMDARGYRSEVDAVRYLLARGLDATETPEQLRERLARMEPRAAADAAILSPLTSKMEFEANRTVVSLTCGGFIEIPYAKAGAS